MDLLYQPFHLFIEYPLAGLLPAALFGCGFACDFRKCRTRWRFSSVALLLAGILWIGYTAWEFYVSRSYPPESVPIRVDLLFIAPTLWIVSAAAIVAWLICRVRRSTE